MTHDLDGSAGTRTGLLASRRGASIDISHRAHCSPPMLLVRAWWWQPWQQLVKRRRAEGGVWKCRHASARNCSVVTVVVIIIVGHVVHSGR